MHRVMVIRCQSAVVAALQAIECRPQPVCGGLHGRDENRNSGARQTASSCRVSSHEDCKLHDSYGSAVGHASGRVLLDSMLQRVCHIALSSDEPMMLELVRGIAFSSAEIGILRSSYCPIVHSIFVEPDCLHADVDVLCHTPV